MEKDNIFKGLPIADANILKPMLPQSVLSVQGRDITNDISRQITEQNKKHFEEISRTVVSRTLRDEENNNNIKKLVENTEIQIKQKDEDLENQRELIRMLKSQLTGINRAINDLFILEENNQEVQQEANNLAKEIHIQMIQNKKIDWKAIAIDKGIDITLAAIPIILQMAKVIS